MDDAYNAEYSAKGITLTVKRTGWQTGLHLIKAVGKHRKILYRRFIGDSRAAKMLFEKLKDAIDAGEQMDGMWLSEGEFKKAYQKPFNG